MLKKLTATGCYQLTTCSTGCQAGKCPLRTDRYRKIDCPSGQLNERAKGLEPNTALNLLARKWNNKMKKEWASESNKKYKNRNFQFRIWFDCCIHFLSSHFAQYRPLVRSFVRSPPSLLACHLEFHYYQTPMILTARFVSHSADFEWARERELKKEFIVDHRDRWAVGSEGLGLISSHRSVRLARRGI